MLSLRFNQTFEHALNPGWRRVILDAREELLRNLRVLLLHRDQLRHKQKLLHERMHLRLCRSILLRLLLLLGEHLLHGGRRYVLNLRLLEDGVLLLKLGVLLQVNVRV